MPPAGPGGPYLPEKAAPAGRPFHWPGGCKFCGRFMSISIGRALVPQLPEKAAFRRAAFSLVLRYARGRGKETHGDHEPAQRRPRLGRLEGREEGREAEGEGGRARDGRARRLEQVGDRGDRSGGQRRALLLAQEVGRHDNVVTEEGFLRPGL